MAVRKSGVDGLKNGALLIINGVGDTRVLTADDALKTVNIDYLAVRSNILRYNLEQLSVELLQEPHFAHYLTYPALFGELA